MLRAMVAAEGRRSGCLQGWSGNGSSTERLAKERRARLAAERLLEQKTRELFAANEKLALHARVLSDQIVEQREMPRFGPG
jgi:hypothetical protein